MELSWVHKESGNEHWDEYTTVILKANEDQIVLVETTQTKNAIHHSDETKSDQYTIPASDLIELIKTDGEIISDASRSP